MLRAIGLSGEEADSSIRFGFSGASTNGREVEVALRTIAQALAETISIVAI